MTWRTLTHRGPKNKVPTRTHCLVCWPEEGDSLSVVAVKKIVTPRPDDLAPDTFCKVKGLEKYPCRVVAVGTEGEVKAVMNDMQVEEKDDEPCPPPKKKARTELPKKNRGGKENHVPRSGQGKGTSTTKKKGRIIIVSGDGKTPSEKQSDPSEQVSTSPSPAEQSDTASDGKTPGEKQSDPPATSPSPAEQPDTASDDKTPSEKQSDPPEQVSTSPSPAEQSDTATTLEETSNSLSKAQTSNSTAPLELVQPSLEQLQANRVSPTQADNPRDDPRNCSQKEGQGNDEELKEDSDDGKITCMCSNALDTLTLFLQVHVHVHVQVHTCTLLCVISDQPLSLILQVICF